MNGNSLISEDWMPALSRYTTAQLMWSHVILRADKRLAGTSAVQTIIIYQFVVLTKINRLTLKRFEKNTCCYLDLRLRLCR